MQLALHAYDHLHSFFVRNEELSLASVGVVFLLLIVGMSVVTLTVLNTKATKGYQLNALETQRQELITDNEITDTLILRAQSMVAIEEASQHMVRPSGDNIYYVVPASAVAVN